jgi:arginase family enzyme
MSVQVSYNSLYIVQRAGSSLNYDVKRRAGEVSPLALTGAYHISTLSLKPLQHRVGVDKGPIHLVNAGLVGQLKDLGWVVEFDGHHQFEDISAAVDPPIGKLRNPRLVSKVTEAVGRVVGECASKGSLPLTLGGDHSLAMGTIAGTLS